MRWWVEGCNISIFMGCNSQESRTDFIRASQTIRFISHNSGLYSITPLNVVIKCYDLGS